MTSKTDMNACDAVVGPCSCGAWHSTQDAETRVAELRARAEKAEQAARRMARLLAEVLDCGVSARSRDYDEVQLDHQLRREITAALREGEKGVSDAD